MKKQNAAAPPRRRRVRWPWVLGAIAAAAAAILAFRLLTGRGSLPRIAREWSSLGVDKPNVVIVTLDTTRADRLGAYGCRAARTPALDALAGRGALFEQCATVAPLTLPAHSTIFTGLPPTFHGVRVNGNTALSDEQTTLAEVMASRGYACGAFIAAFVLDGRWGLKQGFEHYDDRFDLKKYKQLDLGAVQRPGNEIMDAALAWLEGRKDNPFFAWIHLYDPHTPYAPPEPYYSRFAPGGPAGLYDGEIAFMDEQIGRLTSWLERSGLDRRTILLFVGDHGEGLGSHGESSHGYFIYDYAQRVPLIVVTPLAKGRGVRVTSQVSTVDVFATILELAGMSVPAGHQGRSLVPLMFGRKETKEEYAYGESMAPNIQFGWAALTALRTVRYKFIDAPRLELYDLEKDPAESENIAGRNPALVRDFKARLDRFVKESGRGAPKLQAADLDKETMARLSALGYIGAPVASKKTGGGAPADPKDKLLVYESVQRAGEMIMGERYDEAAVLLEETLRSDPEIAQALLLLATCRSETGKTEEAKEALLRILGAEPENIQALISLANILMSEGRMEEVAAVCEQTLAVDEKSVQAHMLLGEVYMAEEKHAEALPFLEKAYEIQPKLTQNGLNLAACLIGLDQFERAEPLLKSVIEENPRFPFANFNLGLLYEGLGRWEDARRAYTEEIASYPQEYRARFNRGKIFFRLGERQAYLDEMREVVAIAPRQAEGYLFLARGLLNEPGSIDEAAALVEKGLSLAVTDELKAFGYFLQADVFNRKGQPDKMRAALEKANAFKSKEESAHE